MSDEPPATPPEPDPHTVARLHDAAEAILEDERERGRALDAKTAQLAAFSGTILTLDVTLGSLILREDFGCVANIVLPVLFLSGAVGLIVSAAYSINGVLKPQAYLGIERDEVRAFARYPLLALDETTVRARLLTTISDRLLPRERSQNNVKAERTKYAAIALLIGLAAIAGQALTLSLDQLGV